MFRPVRIFGTLLGLGLAFGLGFSLRAHGQDDASFDLITFRTALEQLRAGRAANAQILLEGSGRSETLAPENALLLAYLQDEARQREAARRTLANIETPSPLALAYLRRLGGEPQAIEARTGAAKTTARLAATDARLSKLEAFMVTLVNAEREKRGLSALEVDGRLADVARAHSAEMRDKNYFAHESPTPSLRTPLDRYRAGYGGTPRIIAENIYRAYGGRSSISTEATREAQTAFMNSPGHRENILTPDVSRIGIGFCTNAQGDIWITQMFSRRN